VRYTRGLFQSLGAGGSLLAAAACALLAISTAVGFRGWPGLDRGSDAGRDLLVAAGPAHPRAQQAGRPSGEFAARPRVLAAVEPGPSRPAARRAPAASTPTPASSPAPAASAPAPASSSSPVATTPAAPAAPPAARHVADRLADTVRGTGQTAGTVLAPVSPTAAQTVTDTTDKVAGLVDKTGDALAP
jgi:hypothetical protein